MSERINLWHSRRLQRRRRIPERFVVSQIEVVVGMVSMAFVGE